VVFAEFDSLRSGAWGLLATEQWAVKLAIRKITAKIGAQYIYEKVMAAPRPTDSAHVSQNPLFPD
jgi:hypothetical protein